MPPHGPYQPRSHNSPHQFPVQQPVRTGDLWPSGETYEAEIPTAQKRRRGYLYNGQISDFSSAPEAQNIVPRPMSMQSQFSQQSGLRGVSEQVQQFYPVQPSIGMLESASSPSDGPNQ